HRIGRAVLSAIGAGRDAGRTPDEWLLRWEQWLNLGRFRFRLPPAAITLVRMPDVTRLLEAAAAGDRRAAADLLPFVYDELRKLAAARMAAESPGHTLDATALVHEAYLRLVDDQQFDGRG